MNAKGYVETCPVICASPNGGEDICEFECDPDDAHAMDSHIAARHPEMLEDDRASDQRYVRVLYRRYRREPAS